MDKKQVEQQKRDQEKADRERTLKASKEEMDKRAANEERAHATAAAPNAGPIYPNPDPKPLPGKVPDDAAQREADFRMREQQRPPELDQRTQDDLLEQQRKDANAGIQGEAERRDV